jgi:glutamine synthetase
VVHRRARVPQERRDHRPELENAFTEGIGFDGSSIDGFARVQEADMLAVPDASTFQVLPWRPESQGVARMFCDILTPDGQPFAADPRYVLKRTLERAAEMGFTFYVHPEMEFFLFESARAPVPLDNGSYFDMTPLDVQQDFRRQTINMLERMGISVEYSHHEVAPSQHEIDLRYADALTMADNIMTFRLVVKETALQRGASTRRSCPSPSRGSGATRCTCTCRCSRATPTRSTTLRPLPAVADRAGVHRGVLAHAP